MSHEDGEKAELFHVDGRDALETNTAKLFMHEKQPEALAQNLEEFVELHCGASGDVCDKWFGAGFAKDWNKIAEILRVNDHLSRTTDDTLLPK